ncbi:hypothetical protein NFC81_08285 [Salinispirillum sp. LH 10-3-1]|uniref:Uncharacterized protein n=1 Tax=Salinispirillum sp. LH 10-3-1 TaxID=2952525 RepID=A0AB38YBS0_9GAMM
MIVESQIGKPVREERRKGPDIIIKVTNFLSIAALILMLPPLIIIERARPEMESLFDRWFRVTVQAGWDLDVLQGAVLYIVAVFFLSAAGLVLNFMRHKRKDDRIRFTLMIPLAFSIFGGLYVLLRLI